MCSESQLQKVSRCTHALRGWLWRLSEASVAGLQTVQALCSSTRFTQG